MQGTGPVLICKSNALIANTYISDACTLHLDLAAVGKLLNSLWPFCMMRLMCRRQGLCKTLIGGRQISVLQSSSSWGAALPSASPMTSIWISRDLEVPACSQVTAATHCADALGCAVLSLTLHAARSVRSLASFQIIKCKLLTTTAGCSICLCAYVNNALVQASCGSCKLWGQHQVVCSSGPKTLRRLILPSLLCFDVAFLGLAQPAG